jgi:glycosyltransferase involved in cell wall biosynthesis
LTHDSVFAPGRQAPADQRSSKTETLPIRVAVLAPRLTVRGPLPKLTPVLVEALRRRGCEVELLPWGRRFEGERLPSKLLSRARDVARARRAVVRGGFPIVVVHTSHDWLTLSRDLVLTRALVWQGRVVVLQFHGSQSPRLVAAGSWLFKRATAALLAAADGILVLSREEQAEWQRFRPRTRVYVVRNPLPDLPAAGGEVDESVPDEPIVLCVSRLLEGKGVLELVRACAIVREHVPCRLVFAGEGPELERIRALAEELGMEGSVDLVGYLQDKELATMYRQATVFVLPTALSEGFPMAVMEAMAAGLPIVTTPSRGSADHLEEGRHALFAPARDPEALADRITRLLQDDDLREGMREANRTRARRFEADEVAAEYHATLVEVARSREGRVRGHGVERARGLS